MESFTNESSDTSCSGYDSDLTQEYSPGDGCVTLGLGESKYITRYRVDRKSQWQHHLGNACETRKCCQVPSAVCLLFVFMIQATVLNQKDVYFVITVTETNIISLGIALHMYFVRTALHDVNSYMTLFVDDKHWVAERNKNLNTIADCFLYMGVCLILCDMVLFALCDFMFYLHWTFLTNNVLLLVYNFITNFSSKWLPKIICEVVLISITWYSLIFCCCYKRAPLLWTTKIIYK